MFLFRFALIFTMKRAGFFWLCLLLASIAGAQPPNSIRVGPTESGEIPLQDRLSFLVDSSGRLSLQAVIQRQRDGQFQRSGSRTVRQDFGYNITATHWLFFELNAPAAAPPTTRLMLEIEYANLDELELVAVRGGQMERLGLTGDRFQYAQRPYRNNNYVLPITIRAGERVGYFLRIRQPHAILSFFVRLWHRPAFVASDRTEYLVWGLFIGIICMVLVLNFVLLVALRDWIYAWYNGYLHFITMHLFTDAGLSFQYLWPTAPRLNELSPVYLYVWAAMVCQTTFMQYFILQNRRNSRVFPWIQAFKVFVTVALVVSIVIPLLEVPGREAYMYRFVSLATSGYVLIIAGLTIWSLREAGRRAGRERVVRYYSYALAVQFTGYIVVAVMNFCQAQGWPLPFDVETYAVLGLTVLADLVFYTYGLTYRYQQAKHRNQQLELSLLNRRQEAQQQVISSLEDEHRRLAQDLHDDVGPLLATAKGYLSRLARTKPMPLLRQAQTLLDEAADELRLLSHQLLPPQLNNIGLVRTIAEAAQKAGRRGVPVQFVSMGQERPLGRQREQLLFSVATQLIRDAQQHPHATEVVVQLLYHEDQVNLSVEDDGRAMTPSDTDEANLRAKTDLLKADRLVDATELGNSVMVSLRIANLTPV